MAVEPWRRIEPTIKTKIDYRDIIIKTFEVPGKDKVMTIATFLNEDIQCAGVVALTKDKQVIVARQFRHGPEKIMSEIPGGGFEVGDDPESCARRELAEETGYIPGSMQFLGTTSRDAYMNGKWHYFLALDCEPSPDGTHFDENEQIEVGLISIDEFINSAKNGLMTDPVAVLMVHDKLRELQNG